MSHPGYAIHMLRSDPNVHGSMPKLEEPLIAYLTSRGYDVSTTVWGRHREGENVFQKLVGRSFDVVRIRSQIATDNADIIFVNTSHHWPTLIRDLPLLLFLRTASRRVVIQLHGSAYRRAASSWAFRIASRLLLSCADVVLVLSREEAEGMRSCFPNTRIEVVSYIYSPPETASASPPGHSSRETLRLLFAGRLVKEKGILQLIEALTLMPELNVCVTIAGQGQLEDEISRRLAESPLLSRRVAMVGYLTGPELAAAYTDSDVFVLPTYHDEGFPHALLDAMAYGLGIVCTSTRGIRDHLQDTIDALFVPPNDARALAAAITRLACDRTLLERIRVSAQVASRRFLPSESGPRYESILHSLFNRC